MLRRPFIFHMLMLAATLSTTPVPAAEPDLPEVDIPSEATDPTKALVKRINDATGLEFWGYARGGFYGARNGAPKAGYSLGGDLQKFRLGNEADNYIEFGVGKRFDLGNGVRLGAFYMPTIYDSVNGTAQLYTSLSGLSFAPAWTFWAGQRYHRIADIHILDHWLVQDGDNLGGGVDAIPIGPLGKLNLAVQSSSAIDNTKGQPNNARRFNFQWTEIPTNPGGKLTITGATVSGDFVQGSAGGAWGVLHQQKDLLPGLNNALFLQSSSGHASIEGRFYNLDTRDTTTGLFLPGALDIGGGNLLVPVIRTTLNTPQPGARQRRFADAIDFQQGRWGAQALAGYQTLTPDNGTQQRDISLGARVSYGLARYVKLLAELGGTRRSIEGQPTQRLSKGTLAVALSPDTRFWTRPELRLYATHAQWNDAAAQANASSFGAHGTKSANVYGVQLEVWWE